MKSSFTAFTITLLLFSSLASADTSTIWTTFADSSNVSFIARTPLSWETVVNDSLRYIRFADSPVTDSIGYPELPMITCLVAVPDGVHPSIEFAFSGESIESIYPVYPAPACILVSDSCTPMFVDSFVQDSTAYASASFWPAERVRLIGETRICDQRLLKIQLFPAQYRAADSTLSTVSSFSVSVSWDSSEAVWSSIGLGGLQRMVEGSPIVGYHNEDQTHAPVPDYFGVVDPIEGPQYPNNRMPDYVIICASGLYAQCSEAIIALAEHRVSINGFDVATVLTDSIRVEFGDEEQAVIDDETIREFTEYMWENWPQASVKKPDYLLLIGDHEDPSYGAADWFLPTHVYADYVLNELVEGFGNDEWYAYMNGDPDIKNDFPSFAVGRLSVRNGGTEQPDTLTAMIDNIIALEQPIVATPVIDNRRSFLRLAGTGDNVDTFLQVYKNWGPTREATGEFCDWLGYNYRNHYCGDGRNFSSSDGSILSSEDFRDACIDELKTGAGVAFYTNHGDLHMFSAGLEWCPEYYVAGDDTKGCRDSTFNNYQIETQLTSTNQYYSAPFMLMLCCSAGTFNHTLHDHQGRSSHQYFCYWEQNPVCDFGTDCLAEKLFKNTAVPVAGVFASSMPAGVDALPYYGLGILKAVYWQGFGRMGDAIAYSRFSSDNFFMMGYGGYQVSLGQFNLLGDPALDISDRVRYPNKCDLVIYPDDISIGYPTETANGFDLPVQFVVHNNGRLSSGSYSTRFVFSSGQSVNTGTVSCSSINSCESDTINYTWQCTSGFVPPCAISISVEADYQTSCTDSWRVNNTAEISYQLNDVYPIDSGWPVRTTGIVQTTPILINLDEDSELEVVAQTGSFLTAYDLGQTVTPLWRLGDEGFCGSEQPLTADIDQDGNAEILVACWSNEIKIVGNDGSLLYTLTGASRVFAVGDMHQRPGLELCTATADGRYLNLYYWDNNRMNFIATKDFGYTGLRHPVSLSIAAITGGTYADAVYFNGGTAALFPEQEEKTSFEIYNWGTSSLEYSDTWNEYLGSVGGIRLSAGMISETGAAGFPQGNYDTTSDPALIIEPDEASPEISCSNTNVQIANNLNCGVFADWNSLEPGADSFVLPSEKQCMAWDVDGDPFNNFPTSAFSGSQQGSPVSPTALGNLDNTGDDDVLFCTMLNGDWSLLGYASSGNPLTSSGFPYVLPEGITASGGSAIGDLDRDGKVEIVFGTDDGMLHCWEFGTCSTGYVSWPQYQHDCGRTGVLE